MFFLWLTCGVPAGLVGVWGGGCSQRGSGSVTLEHTVGPFWCQTQGNSERPIEVLLTGTPRYLTVQPDVFFEMDHQEVPSSVCWVSYKIFLLYLCFIHILIIWFNLYLPKPVDWERFLIYNDHRSLQQKYKHRIFVLAHSFVHFALVILFHMRKTKTRSEMIRTLMSPVKWKSV